MIHLMSSPFSSMNHYPYHYYTNSFYPHQNPMQSPTQHLQHPLLLPHTHSPNSKLHYADSTQPSMENLLLPLSHTLPFTHTHTHVAQSSSSSMVVRDLVICSEESLGR